MVRHFGEQGRELAADVNSKAWLSFLLVRAPHDRATKFARTVGREGQRDLPYSENLDMRGFSATGQY